MLLGIRFSLFVECAIKRKIKGKQGIKIGAHINMALHKRNNSAKMAAFFILSGNTYVST